MGRAKDIIIQRIDSRSANAFIQRTHYSGSVVRNSQLHFGAFLGGRLHGVLSFGPPMDRRKLLGLVQGTGWNEMIELNRLAFDEVLPRNSESRAIAVAIHLIRKHCPHVKWIVSFADATRCGDGTIYRASGFHLTGIRRNQQIGTLNGRLVSKMTITKDAHAIRNKGRAGVPKEFAPLPGFQLRYVYFIDPTARERLTVPILPFSSIAEVGAAMYKGKKRAPSFDSEVLADQAREGGASPTEALQSLNTSRL